MSPSYDLRPARKSDAAEAALLVNIAVHGGVVRFWAEDRQAEGTYDPLEVGRLHMMRDDNQLGWRSATMAEVDGEVIGMLLGYRKDDDYQAFDDGGWPPMLPIEELEAQANGCWFISMLGVHKPWRGKGAGSVLLGHAEGLAQASNAKGQALIVDDANEGARRLYHSRGFRVKASRPIVPFPGAPQQGTDWLLMVKE